MYVLIHIHPQHEHAKGKKASHECVEIKKIVKKEKKKKTSLFLSMFSSSEELEIEYIPICVKIAEKRGWKSYKVMADKEAESIRKDEARKARNEENRPMLKEAFDMFDLDGSGILSPDEIKALLYDNLCEPVSEKEVEEAIKTMDADGNGGISFEEFLDWFSNDTLRAKDGSNMKLKALQFKLKTAKNFKDFKSKLLPESIYVPGFYPPVYLLVKMDYYNKKDALIRYVSSEYKIEIQDDMLEERAIEAFEEKFMPIYNSGRLDEVLIFFFLFFLLLTLFLKDILFRWI